MGQDDLIGGMISFVEENWIAFIYRMAERGFNESDVEREIKTLALLFYIL